jgi:hypothetical protein
MRSGHDHTNLCAVFEYIWANFYLQATAGRSLGGWPNPQHRVCPPNFNRIVENLKVDPNLVTNFIHVLLQIEDDNLGLHGRLWMFSLTCAATLMMYYPEFKKQVGSHHLAVKHVEAVLTKFGINSAGLRDWSHEIRTGWDHDNAHCLVCSNDNAVTEAIQAQLNLIFQRLSMLMEQGRMIENQIKEIYDLLADIMKHQGIHSPPRKTGQEEKPRYIEASLNSAHFTEGEGKSQVASESMENASIAQEKLLANRLLLKKYDNSSQYALNTLHGLTISRAIRDWVKYKLNSSSVRGVGFTSDSKADHIIKMKFVVLYALEKAKELDPYSLNVLQEAEPTENDPDHALWGIKINNAAKSIESKLITFLCGMSDTEVTTQATVGATVQKKKKQKNDLGNPTIN